MSSPDCFTAPLVPTFYRPLKRCFFVFVACFLAAPALDACSCADRGPTCKWFPSYSDPAFVGRVIEMEPGSDNEFYTQLETALRPFIGDAAMVTPMALRGETFAVYIRVLRDFWRSTIRPESLDELGNVSDYDEFLSWTARSGFGAGRRLVRFAVSEVFAGEVGKTIDIDVGIGGGSACEPDFEVGEEYLVFAHHSEGQWSTNTCSGGGQTASMEEELEYLRAYDTVEEVGSFVGIASERNWSPRGHAENSRAVDAEIEASNDDRLWKTRTDHDGRFSINGLKPGRYSVSGQYQGEPLLLDPGDLSEPDAIQLVPARGCAFVRLDRPAPSGTVIGRIFGPTADAVAGIWVNAVPMSNKVNGNLARTDQDGRFLLETLQPGEYFVGVNIKGAPKPDQPYASVYYPGVSVKDGASIAGVSNGATTDVGMMKLGRRLVARKIVGKVEAADGQPLANVRVQLFSEDDSFLISCHRTCDDGSFELEGFQGTAYIARAEIRTLLDGTLVTAEAVVPAEGNAPITVIYVP